MAELIRVLVADDHALIRAGLTKTLASEADIKIVGEASDGMQAVVRALELTPDVVLMDITMPKLSGLDALAAIKEKLPAVRVLILTVSDNEDDLFQALRFGADGYLLKTATVTEMVQAVRKTAAGEAVLSPHVTERLLIDFRERHEDKTGLSARETEVLRLVGDGLSNTEIARRMFLSESTVRTYLERLIDKLHLRNRAEAIAYAVHHSLTEKVR